jgi:16S rRNA processing protein RimM
MRAIRLRADIRTRARYLQTCPARAERMPDARQILVGVFGAPHGVRGELRVKSFTQDPRAIGGYSPLTDRAGARAFKFTALRLAKDDMLVVRVEGVANRDAAQKLTGVELFAPRDRLPPPDEDEFYHADLIGLAAVTREGEMLGEVVAIRNFGAGDILEISPTGGGETLLLPFTKAAAPEIDFGQRRIVVAPPREIEGEAMEDAS